MCCNYCCHYYALHSTASAAHPAALVLLRRLLQQHLLACSNALSSTVDAAYSAATSAAAAATSAAATSAAATAAPAGLLDALEALPVDCAQLVMQHHSILANPVCLLLLAPDLLIHALQAEATATHRAARQRDQLSEKHMISRTTVCMQRIVLHVL
jgi:3-oxoacyl-ACP reductase-like protein